MYAKNFLLCYIFYVFDEAVHDGLRAALMIENIDRDQPLRNPFHFRCDLGGRRAGHLGSFTGKNEMS